MKNHLNFYQLSWMNDEFYAKSTITYNIFCIEIKKKHFGFS